MALASSFNGGNAQTALQNASVTPVAQTLSTEDQVEAYFSDIPVMVEIARCESRMRHYDKNGNVIHGEIDSGDIGVMQINERYHRDTAKKLNLEINKLQDNMVYARKLYEREGTTPWASSSKCWAKTQVASK